MHPRTAAFLSRFSERTLAAAAARGDRNAIEAMWQAWLRHPDDERWELLAQCRSTQEMADAVFAAATDPARPAASRAAIGAFCTSRSLVPAGNAERALFYMLIGQPAQHRAADPGGEALAAAYQAVNEQVRAALREAMADSGDLDMARVVAARRENPAPTGEAERAFLLSELTRGRDWPRLWRLAQDLPLAEAVAAVRRLPRNWRPADEAGRELLSQFAGARPAEIRAMATSAVIRLNAGFQENPSRCFFAPDGSAMAVNRWFPRFQPSLSLYALPGGRREAGFRHSPLPCDEDEIAVFPGGVVFLGLHGGGTEHRLFRYVNGHGTEEFADSDVRIFPHPRLAAMPGGFVVAEPDRLLYGTAEPGSGLRDVTPPSSWLAAGTGAITRVATEPDSGCIAIVVLRRPHNPDHLLVLGPDFRVIDQVAVPKTGATGISWIGFCGPGRLITRHGHTEIRSWRVGPPTEAEAATELHNREREIRPVPSAGLIMTEYFGREYLDAGTLRPAECPAALAWVPQQRDHHLYLSPDGGYAALWRSWLLERPWDEGSYSYKGEIEVRDLVREEFSELGRRPLASFRPADLAAVTALAGRAGDRPVRTALGLLRACLEYRFGADVAIGDAPAPVPGTDDIALSAEP